MSDHHNTMNECYRNAGKRFINFVNETGSPYHSVLASKRLLLNKGFIPLSEKATLWSSSTTTNNQKNTNLQPGGKYFITRNHSEIFAFVIGNKFKVSDDDNSNSRMIMIGAHTDSPCLRLRPRSCIKPKDGIIQLGVTTYGGGLWHTWFDRGLGMAGKVIINNNNTIEERLIRVNRPIAIIPNLAIHLQTSEERNAGFKINPEEHLMPVFCSSKYYKSADPEHDIINDDVNGNHRALMELLAKEAKCSIEDIIDFDICLMDATPSSIIGVYDEFISSPRIDNLLSTWACMDALSSHSDHLINGNDIYIAAAFDHEECGSTSYTGANSMTLHTWMKRILSSLNISDNYLPSIIARSILVSADGAHGIHPNYSSKHQSEHKVYLHDGIVIKNNANQRYATTPLTASMIRTLCSKDGGHNNNSTIPIQDFVVRNDSPCGSTIGPMMSANLGIRTIDLGAPQWAMHSCRETCSVDDAGYLVELCGAIYDNWADIDDSLVEVVE